MPCPCQLARPRRDGSVPGHAWLPGGFGRHAAALLDHYLYVDDQITMEPVTDAPALQASVPPSLAADLIASQRRLIATGGNTVHLETARTVLARMARSPGAIDLAGSPKEVDVQAEDAADQLECLAGALLSTQAKTAPPSPPPRDGRHIPGKPEEGVIRIATYQRDEEMIVLRDRMIPLLRLRSLFGCPNQADADEINILVVELDESEVGLVVDRFHASVDVIVNGMSELRDIAGSSKPGLHRLIKYTASFKLLAVSEGY